MISEHLIPQDYHVLPMGQFQYGQTNITGFRIVREKSSLVQEFTRYVTKEYSRVDKIKIVNKFSVTVSTNPAV